MRAFPLDAAPLHRASALPLALHSPRSPRPRDIAFSPRLSCATTCQFCAQFVGHVHVPLVHFHRPLSTCHIKPTQHSTGPLPFASFSRRLRLEPRSPCMHVRAPGGPLSTTPSLVSGIAGDSHSLAGSGLVKATCATAPSGTGLQLAQLVAISHWLDKSTCCYENIELLLLNSKPGSGFDWL